MKFEKMSLEETAGILEWSIIIDDGILPVEKYVLDLYPKLKKINDWKIFSVDERTNLIKKMIEEDYIRKSIEIGRVLLDYENIWAKYDVNFTNGMKRVLNIDFAEKIKNITVKVGNIPIYPRDISTHCFYIGKMKEEFFIETVMHEYCHFVYFEKWKELFKNWKIEEFDSPHLIWNLSEMAIDPILNNEKIQKVYKHKFMAYENFYKININGKNLMNTINEIYSKHTVEEAIIKSYEYVLENQKYVILK